MGKRSVLDGLARATWFFGVNLKAASCLIATIGFFYPAVFTFTVLNHDYYLLPWHVATWVLAIFWSLFSFLLYVAVGQNIESLYLAYIWYTLLFAVLMMMLFAGMISHCCIYLRVHGIITLALILAFSFYAVVVIWFACVVNSTRMEAFPVRSVRAKKENAFTIKLLNEYSE